MFVHKNIIINSLNTSVRLRHLNPFALWDLMLSQHQVFKLWSAGVRHHVVVVSIFCRNPLPASHQYETLEQIHPTACDNIPNVTGWSHMNIKHTHTNSRQYLMGQLVGIEDIFSWEVWKGLLQYWFHIFPNTFLVIMSQIGYRWS